MKNKIIKNFFNEDELEVLHKYCFNKLENNQDYEDDADAISPAWYDDALMTSLLHTKQKIIEKDFCPCSRAF